MDITKIESQSLKLNKERFNLNDIILTCISDIKAQLISSNPEQLKKLSFDYYPRDLFVNADKNRITQVIFNLLSNSVKFTEKGSISITVATENDPNGTINIITSIKDTGCGIDAEIIPRLFTKFASKSFEGTGLGLFISKSIVISHGGQVWAVNNKDSGATFYFKIPQE